MDAQSGPPDGGEQVENSAGRTFNASGPEDAENASGASNAVPEKPKRSSLMAGLTGGAAYIDKERARDRVTFRTIDRVTSILLGVCLLIAGIFLLLPNLPAALFVGFDLCFGVLIIIFMLCRFGLVRALTPRQAIIVWELVFGATLFGAFLAVHIQFFMSLIGHSVNSGH